MYIYIYIYIYIHIYVFTYIYIHTPHHQCVVSAPQPCVRSQLAHSSVPPPLHSTYPLPLASLYCHELYVTKYLHAFPALLFRLHCTSLILCLLPLCIVTNYALQATHYHPHAIPALLFRLHCTSLIPCLCIVTNYALRTTHYHPHALPALLFHLPCTPLILCLLFPCIVTNYTSRTTHYHSHALPTLLFRRPCTSLILCLSPLYIRHELHVPTSIPLPLYILSCPKRHSSASPYLYRSLFAKEPCT